jgi:hypothetical protein
VPSSEPVVDQHDRRPLGQFRQARDRVEGLGPALVGDDHDTYARIRHNTPLSCPSR